MSSFFLLSSGAAGMSGAASGVLSDAPLVVLFGNLPGNPEALLSAGVCPETAMPDVARASSRDMADAAGEREAATEARAAGEEDAKLK